jgi:hypothetical protein
MHQNPNRTSSSSCHDKKGEEEGFTFATVQLLPAGTAFPVDGRVGTVYPVFDDPRSPRLREAEDRRATWKSSS